MADREKAMTETLTTYARLNVPASTIEEVVKTLTDELEQLKEMRDEAKRWMEETEAAEQRANDLAALAELARTRLAAADAPHRVPVTVTCRVLGLARQPYYRWLASPVTDAELTEAYRAGALFDAHRDDPEFGHRFLLDEARAAGEAMAERTAWRICRDNRWWSVAMCRFGVSGWVSVTACQVDALSLVGC
ncbi:hypothetical protein ACPCAJ_35915 [Streptomyces griseoincarnatus]